jgi:DNA-binding NtrC family response regulator
MSSSRQKDERYAELRTPLEPRLAEAIQRIAGSDCPVLIMGERGLGKCSIAELVHSLSKRSAGTYKVLDAAETDNAALSAELAGTGTLTLVEVADLPFELQAEVVRCFRAGITAPKNRLISTTSQELTEAVRQGKMREDFYYLIASVSLRIAPLRVRDLELLALAESLLERYARRYERPKPELGPELQSFLLQHTWPGNLAELELSMKACVVLGDSDFSLAALRAAAPRNADEGGGRSWVPLKDATRAASFQMQKQLLAQVLHATNWNRKQAARELNISYKTLLYKLKQSGLSELRIPGKGGLSQ